MTGVDATTLLRRLAGEAVFAQRALDGLADSAMARWDEAGVPPSGAAYARVAVAGPVRVTATSRAAAGTPARIRLAATRGAGGRIAITFRRAAT